MVSVVDPEIIVQLNNILQHEMAGVVRYTHYSFMVFGYSRIPVVGWLRQSAAETLEHAHRAGEMITHLGEHPSLGIGERLERPRHSIDDILNESLEYERQGVEMYYQLLELLDNQVVAKRSTVSVMLEEYARELIAAEERHVGDLDKMLRKPGTLESVVDLSFP